MRALPLATVVALVGALLVVVTVSSFQHDDELVTGTPAQVEKNEIEVTPEPERPDYTAEHAAEVDVVDQTTPALSSGTIVAELSPHDLPEFELLGVTWTGGVPAEVSEVQVRWSQDGHWSPWTILGVEENQVEGGIPGTEPKWVGPSEAAQVRVVSSQSINPEGLTLVTVAGGDAPTITPAAAATGQPPIIMRGQWGARAYGGSGCGAAPGNGTFSGTIVHHTAGNNTYTAAQSAGIVKSIQAYHMDGQKWCDIGYNFLVDAYGQIFEGRAGGITKTPYGAHAGNTQVNANTTGVSLLGTFTSVEPTAAAKQAVIDLISWRHLLFGVPATGAYSIGGVTIQRIDGHYRVKSTACPGAGTIAWMTRPGGLRDQVEVRVAAGLGPSQAQKSQIDAVYNQMSSRLGGVVSDYIWIPGQIPGAARQYATGSIYSSVSGTHAVLEPLRSRYFAAQGSTGPLGWPTTGPIDMPQRAGGQAQAFNGGSIYGSNATGFHAVTQPVLDQYFATGGATGAYGWPIGEAVAEAGGHSQPFEKGRLYGIGASWRLVDTAIDTAYRSAGGPAKLGWPASDVLSYADGRGGKAQVFSGGSVYSSSVGAFVVSGAHLAEYFRHGGASGYLGWPASAVTCSGNTCTQKFDGGTIVENNGTVSVTVAAIDQVAAAEASKLGGRTSGVIPIVQNGGGHGVAFQNGSVYSSPHGAFAVYPRLLQYYFQFNGAAGAYGFPTAAQECAGGSCYQRFAGGVLTVSASGIGAPGHLAVEQAYARHGGEAGQLGRKTTGVLTINGSGGGVGQVFAGGSVYAGAPGAFPVVGGVRSVYWQYNGPDGHLGWPIADQTCTGTTCTQKFQKGTITWSPSTGGSVS